MWHTWKITEKEWEQQRRRSRERERKMGEKKIYTLREYCFFAHIYIVCIICVYIHPALELSLHCLVYVYSVYVCVLVVYQVAISSAFYNHFGPMNDFVTFHSHLLRVYACVLFNDISTLLNWVSGILELSLHQVVERIMHCTDNIYFLFPIIFSAPVK